MDTASSYTHMPVDLARIAATRLLEDLRERREVKKQEMIANRRVGGGLFGPPSRAMTVDDLPIDKRMEILLVPGWGGEDVVSGRLVMLRPRLNCWRIRWHIAGLAPHREFKDVGAWMRQKGVSREC